MTKIDIAQIDRNLLTDIDGDTDGSELFEAPYEDATVGNQAFQIAFSQTVGRAGIVFVGSGSSAPRPGRRVLSPGGDRVVSGRRNEELIDLSSLLAEAGRALYGERWQAELARDLDLSDRTIRRWVAGTDRVPPGVYIDLLRLTQKGRWRSTRLPIPSNERARPTDEINDLSAWMASIRKRIGTAGELGHL